MRDMPIPDGIPQADQQHIRELLDNKPPEFTELTVTQYEAFEAGVLEDGNHLLVAETGNGKTFVAEAIAKKALQNDNNVAYLVPSVALVGEKHTTLSGWLPEDVIVNKGHGYTETNMIIATFESFYEAVIRGYADRFDTVILDDFHVIYGSHRGPNIEKGISAAIDQDMEIFGISATIGNPHIIARWLDADLIISSEERAVPISEQPVEKANIDYATQIAGLIRSNREKGPFLVFNDTTKHTEARAQGVADTIGFEIDADIDFRSQVEQSIQTELTDKHVTLIRLMNSGIAYHHSKMEKGLKDLIETYTEEGIIKCVFCTTTLSYGFDSPIQSVIVADLKRWDGVWQFIGVYEYVQWIGRAGRDSDVYDQAYAFSLFEDDDACDKFQFDTPVEMKDLEDVTSHLSDQRTLRWLVLELVNYGWGMNHDVLDFIQSTLFWSESVDQIPHHARDELGVQPGHEIADEIEQTLHWLTEHGLLQKPLGQPTTDAVRYTATELGTALVRYEHSNWFENSVQNILDLTEWLADQGDDLLPEKLVEHLGNEYYHCNEGQLIEGESTLSENMDLYDLSGKEGTTAVLICWCWCAGIPLNRIEDVLDGDDLSGLVNTASNLSDAVESVRVLYDPFEMPEEPKWLANFAAQVEAGIPRPDMYLVNNVDHFGRVRYNNLEQQLNRSGGSSSDWDLGPDHFVIERLSKLLAERTERQFQNVVSSSSGIGENIRKGLLSSVKEWSPDNDQTDVPFAESVDTRHDTTDLRESYNPDQSDDGSTSSSGTRSTTLDEYVD